MAALAGRHTKTTVSGRILRIQNDGDIRNLDPANRPGWYDEVVMFAIFSGLCQYRPGKVWGWQLDAAESLSQPDPLHIPFTLRPDIQWTGGFGEVTAEDVKYSYERFFDPRVHADYKTDWEALDEVVVSDRYSGVIRLKHPFSPLFASTLPHASGLIICKEAVEAAGGLFTTAPPATSGPYRIGSWKPRERLVLVRHELWNGPSPYYDEIHLLPMNWTEGETAFDAGDLDMTRINVGSIPVVTAAQKPGVELTILPALAYDWLGMNLANPKLQDIRIRRAIQRAINVPSLLQAVFGGLVPQAFGVVPPPLAGARSQNLYSYDPAPARRGRRIGPAPAARSQSGRRASERGAGGPGRSGPGRHRSPASPVGPGIVHRLAPEHAKQGMAGDGTAPAAVDDRSRRKLGYALVHLQPGRLLEFRASLRPGMGRHERRCRSGA
jgi:peptide/nickel transport system substrate-binding protein